VVPTDDRDGVAEVRADHYDCRVPPLVDEEGGDPPDRDPGRHQGDDPAVAGKRFPERVRAVGHDLRVERARYPACIGEEPLERYHDRNWRKNKRKNLIFSKVSSKIKVTEKRKCAKQEKTKE